MSEIEAKVEELLGRMTLEEKVGQLVQLPTWHPSFPERVRAGGLGSGILASSAYAGNDRQERLLVAQTNALQRVAVEESRLGIPLIFGRDVIHGHRAVAPIPLAQAASWAPELVRAAAEVAAREAAAEGIHWTFTPMLDIARDPRWGRIAEGFGEDPFLAAAMARASVQGYQGDDPSHPERIAACAKHFVGYGAAEGGRDYNTTEIGENTLRNIYLPPFQAAVEAGLLTVMSAFNEISGTPITANRALLTDILRTAWGFDGFVVSDWNAVTELVQHRVAADNAQAAAMALTAGVDLDMCSLSYDSHLAALVRAGTLSEAVLDEGVRRVLRVKFRLGLFERPYTDPALAETVMLRPDHRAAARKFAGQSMVLLKNADGRLPLPKTGLTLGLFGQLAADPAPLLGTWTLDGEPGDVTSISDAVQAKLGADTTLLTASYPDEILSKARRVDVAVMVIGETPERTGEDSSLTTIDLPVGQLELLQALHALRVPLVVVVLTGRPLALGWLHEHADAVLLAWHPGIAGGAAVADLLFGDETPSGKLPVTFPRNAGQVPIYYNYKDTGRPLPRDDRRCTRYQDSPDTPLYPFGYGLSYTSFAYHDLRLNSRDITTGGSVTIQVTVSNIGDCPGEEVVQLYLRDDVASVTRPVKELKGFARVALAPGADETVTFMLGPAELSYYNNDNQRVVDPGTFTLWVGGNSNAELSGTFKVTG
ncbi:MAG TPA: glycoside hydrolase family 3 N-terminal domain-containing protein [Armatimonadota bacterium]|jgi:beta-glucosidase